MICPRPQALRDSPVTGKKKMKERKKEKEKENQLVQIDDEI